MRPVRVHTAGRLRKGLFYGPRGGKWADAAHTIPYEDPSAKRQGAGAQGGSCSVCHGLRHVISRQMIMGGGEVVSSAPCRTCNRAGKVKLDPSKLDPHTASALGFGRAPEAPKGPEPAKKPQQLDLLSHTPKQAPRAPQQASLFDAPRAPPPPPQKIEGKHVIEVHPAIAGSEKAHPLEVHAAQDADGSVRIASSAAGLERGYGTKMPAASFRHLQNDLEGRVDLPASGRPDIDAVISGKAKLLGKGDDGIAFRVGDKVVKVSTTVPYQPFNPGHRSPRDANEMLRKQVEVGNKLASAGVPGMLRSEYVHHGDKGFQIKPYVEIPSKLTQAQLDDARTALLAMHEKGYALNDDVQVGLDKAGKVVLYDIGKAAPAKSEGIFDERREDIMRLRALYQQHGAKMPGEEKKRSSDQLFWDGGFSVAQRLAKEGKIEEAKAKLVKMREMALRTSKSPTIRGDLAEWETNAEEKLGFELPPWETKKSLIFRPIGVASLIKNLPVKDRLVVQGLDVAIENPKGSVRRWYDPQKREHGETTMVHPYGFIEGTKGADGEDIDVFVGPHRDSERVFIVNQKKLEGGGFDEHKVMLGFRTIAEARAAYLRNYDAKGPRLLGTVRSWPIQRFKAWLRAGRTSEPAKKSLR